MNKVKEKIAKFREYLDYFERHYDNVQKAWALLNEKCQNKGFRFISDDFVWHCIDAEVKMHDESKLSAQEFTQYRQRWFPCEGEDQNDEDFQKAWEHHWKDNPHHWQNWTTNGSDYMYGDYYVVIMLCDWVAMGFEFGNTAKSFYEKNKDSINLPEWAIKLMYEIFECIYCQEICEPEFSNQDVVDGSYTLEADVTCKQCGKRGIYHCDMIQTENGHVYKI